MFTKKIDPLYTILDQGYNETFFERRVKAAKGLFDRDGILVLPGFIAPEALTVLQTEADALKPQAYRSDSSYNVYVLPDDPAYDANSARNKKFKTTKGCIADDQIPASSYLKTIYNSDIFRGFLCNMFGLQKLYPYADPLSSININYYDPGDSLEWHFDNADFAITLLLKKCSKGGVYEYFTNMRYAPDGSEDYKNVEKCITGVNEPDRQSIDAGGLMLFKGNQSLHRVTPVEEGERVLVTLNFNTQPNIPLSEKSRQTFFGRIG